MAYPIKYLSLNKTELEYEVSIRGEQPSATVVDLRKQITRLSQLVPAEDILTSQFDPNSEILACYSLMERLKTNISVDNIDKVSLSRIENNLHHLYHRLNRIETTEELEQNYEECRKYFRELYTQMLSLKQSSSDPLTPLKPYRDKNAELPPLEIKVHCEGNSNNNYNEILKIKYDGKTCVRAFLQRIQEFSAARNIPDSKLLAMATEIFTGDALHWFRSIRDVVTSWQEVLHLLKDFDKPDFDYRLIAEIRDRTQGQTEDITIYLAILAGMFARLSKPLSEEDKLEIILHNIRPCYASTLASATSIKSIEQLRLLCKNYETIQSRLKQFHEPLPASNSLLAPEFAYKPTFSQEPPRFKPNNNFSNKQFSQNRQFYPNRQYHNKNKSFNTHTNNNNKHLNAVSQQNRNTTFRQPYCFKCKNNSCSCNLEPKN